MTPKRTLNGSFCSEKFARDRRLSPEVLKAIRRKFGVTHRVLDVLVSEPDLERPSVVARVRQGVAAAMSQHVRMDRKRHLGPNTDAAEQRMECLGRHRPVPLRHKDV